MYEANDNGIVYAVVFFDGPGDTAMEAHRVGGFASCDAAIHYAIEAQAYARQNGIPWYPTEIIFE